jgi:hypothetical protein
MDCLAAKVKADIRRSSACVERVRRAMFLHSTVEIREGPHKRRAVAVVPLHVARAYAQVRARLDRMKMRKGLGK